LIISFHAARQPAEFRRERRPLHALHGSTAPNVATYTHADSQSPGLAIRRGWTVWPGMMGTGRGSAGVDESIDHEIKLLSLSVSNRNDPCGVSPVTKRPPAGVGLQIIRQ